MNKRRPGSIPEVAAGVELRETLLTPELAAQLLANRHPRQRRTARGTVAAYARAMTEGRWRLIPSDPILVDPEGRLLNGAHRCEAVVSSRVSIPIYILWDADETTFDLIDAGRRRSAAQFIQTPSAATRASAVRLILWYERRFDRSPTGQAMGWDTHEILAAGDLHAPALDDRLGDAAQLYRVTSIPQGMALAVLVIADERGLAEPTSTFLDVVREPFGHAPEDPARLLRERYLDPSRVRRRRSAQEDWTMLVRALNLSIEGLTTTKLVMTDLWPRVGEAERDFQLRLTNHRSRMSDLRRRLVERQS